jgi:hypothetical protein
LSCYNAVKIKAINKKKKNIKRIVSFLTLSLSLI